jgi:ASC-1-like (ASCH) protein
MSISGLPSLDDLRLTLQGDNFWGPHLSNLVKKDTLSISLHLAILAEPYLSLILDKQKTVESRFSVDRRSPYNRVKKGEIILLKKTGGPIVGIGQVADVHTYEEIDAGKLQTIREKFGQQLGIDDPTFWENQQKASFATLIGLTHVRPIEKIAIVKRDRRAWVVLPPQPPQLTFT